MSYIKVWIHCVWSTKNRECLIPDNFRTAFLSHIRENAEKKNIILDYTNAHKDHIHALICLGKQETIAQLMQAIKGESSCWVNKMNILPYHFSWQDDYFAVSVSPSHVDRVRRYIKNQDEHHRHMTWDDEVDLFLRKFGFERGEG